MLCSLSDLPGGDQKCSVCGRVYPPGKRFAACRRKPPKWPLRYVGPGTQLARLLAKLRIEAAGCNCATKAAEMDVRGPKWCRENINTIVGWLKENAQARGWPLWSDRAARWWVLIAIRRAEATLAAAREDS